MTRKEAITMLYGIRADNLNLNDAYTKDKYYALTMAIKALEQEPCDCISRQAVLDGIDVKAWEFGDYLISKGNTLREFIRDELPSVNPQERCEDCISRSDAIECLKCDFEITGKRNMETIVNYINSTYDKICDLPSVQPKAEQELKTGHWDKGYTFPDGDYWKCTNCKELIKVKYPMNYCNNCGSKNE